MKNLSKLIVIFILSSFLYHCSSTSDSQNGSNNLNNDIPVNDDGDGSNNSGLPCIESIPPSDVPVFDLEADFTNWTISPYNLPYNVGESYFVNQGNSSGFGHSGFWRYGYDFTMNIGTEILAARSGEVIHANDGTNDGDTSGTNLITIEHDDGTVALYSHLTRNGVLVNVGDTVEQGELIGLSGNTGNTGGLAHLHFSVHPCSGLPGLPDPMNCPTQPVTFKNTEPNPHGLGTWQCYEAL